jgi:hypothetical protein
MINVNILIGIDAFEIFVGYRLRNEMDFDDNIEYI